MRTWARPFVGHGLGAFAVALLALPLGAALACSDEAASQDDEVGTEEACLSARTYFAREAWVRVMGRVCIDCHSPGGIAPAQGANFELQPPGYPAFLDTNFEEVRRVARMQIDGTSQVLLKPLGELSHGGGRVLEQDSEEYRTLTELVSRLESAEECTVPAEEPSFEYLELAGPAGTLRKASLHLAGRLPTPDETQRAVDGGEAALPDLVMGLMADPAFGERLREIFNDLLLTDRYLAYTGYALNLLDEEQFPVAGAYYDTLAEDLQRSVNLSVAREPLDLMAYVVQNDRPFTEVLTADYTVMNGGTAQIYNVNPPSADYGTDLYEARILVQRDGGTIEWPHAGVLTSPMFLNRFPTTPTNRNRHRARMIFELFLATDILAIAERPIDPTESARYINPTRDDPTCNHCHRQLDPLAGAFMKFHDNDQEEYRPDNEWHPEMFAPGFGSEVMQVNDFFAAPQWLAQRIVSDPRFSLSVVYLFYRALTGQQPLSYPSDADAGDYAAERIAAWEAQESTFRAIADRFVTGGHNAKGVIRDIVLSPYYRAVGVTEAPANSEALLAAMGTGRLSTPERLSRKIRAVAGIPWLRGWDRSPWLETDYRILYGGIDSDNVIERLTVPNGVMAAVGWRMANEVSCEATSWDFLLPQGERYLFRHVEATDTPDTARDAIRQNIQYLHAHVLGEDLELDDPEVDRTYRLFEETWREGSAKVASDALPNRLPWSCQARDNPLTGEDLPEGGLLELDESYAIRSWMAVMTYLLSDYKFLYE